LSTPTLLGSRAADLRNTFDRARGAPALLGAEEQFESLLAIRVSGDAYAIRINEIAGLARDRKIVAIATPIPALLGISAIRGALVPVYSLAALLGYGVEGGHHRWLAICGTDEVFCLAFGEFEGYFRSPVARLYAVEQGGGPLSHVRHVIQAAGVARAVVSIPLIKKTIQASCSRNDISKER